MEGAGVGLGWTSPPCSPHTGDKVTLQTTGEKNSKSNPRLPQGLDQCLYISERHPKKQPLYHRWIDWGATPCIFPSPRATAAPCSPHVSALRSWAPARERVGCRPPGAHNGMAPCRTSSLA